MRKFFFQFILLSLIILPLQALAVNNVFFTGITTFDLVTSDTVAPTSLIVDETTYPGNQVTSLDVQTAYIRVTLDDATSTIRFDETNASHYIYITPVVGTGYTITPACPTTNVRLTGGASGTVQLDLTVSTVPPVCPGGGGGGAGHVFPSNYSVTINNGQTLTTTQTVTLTLAAQDSSQVLISNDVNFTGAQWQNFTTNPTTLSWQLLPGDGIKTVYVLYKSSGGNLSMVSSDTIELKTVAVPPVIPPVTPPGEITPPVEPLPGLQFGNLLKASLSTVYYYGADGKRHAFPNENIYRSWYADFSQVKVISDETLAQITLSANVVYRPGVRLLKIQSEPRVYALDAQGTLRWIATEELAIDIYGPNWGSFVDDLSVAFYTDYTIGLAISNSTDFNPALATSLAVDININQQFK